jgi:hypothetical protein
MTQQSSKPSRGAKRIWDWFLVLTYRKRSNVFFAWVVPRSAKGEVLFPAVHKHIFVASLGRLVIILDTIPPWIEADIDSFIIKRLSGEDARLN